MDIKLLFKSLFVSDFSNSVASLLRYYEPEKRLRSSQDGSLFYPRQVRTKMVKHFYSNRVVSIWNSLPKDLRLEQTSTSFVRQLNTFYPSARWARRGIVVPFVRRRTHTFGYYANMVQQIIFIIHTNIQPLPALFLPKVIGQSRRLKKNLVNAIT